MDNSPAQDRNEAAATNRQTYLSVLRMLAFRNARAGGSYSVDRMIESVSGLDSEDFARAMMLMDNPLREAIIGGDAPSSRPTAQAVVSPRIAMSFLVQNTPDAPDAGAVGYTAVFFAEKKVSSVPMDLLRQFADALTIIKAKKILVTEVIYVSPCPLAPETGNRRSTLLSNDGVGPYVQVFQDNELLTPPHLSAYTSRLSALAPADAAELAARRYAAASLTTLSHADAAVKYHGFRPRTIIRVDRPATVPGGAAGGVPVFARVR